MFIIGIILQMLKGEIKKIGLNNNPIQIEDRT